MDHHIPSDVAKAVNILESWEKSRNHSERTRDFEDAIDTLNDYLMDDEHKIIHSYLNNIKRTYTRKLLEELPHLPVLQKGEWFNYIKLLFLTVPDEVDAITKERPNLKESEINFLKIWGDELMEILRMKSNQQTDY